jgi:predicted alpha/beta-hydrolase family hydrolase
MPVKRRTDAGNRRPRETTEARLKRALATLTEARGDGRAAQSPTVTELCRLAGVSRNALYRFHTPVLRALRKQQCRRPSTAQSKVVKSDERRRIENLDLRGHISKLAALVDHHYAAYREATMLLERRDRELAELRRRLKLSPRLVASREP